MKAIKENVNTQFAKNKTVVMVLIDKARVFHPAAYEPVPRCHIN